MLTEPSTAVRPRVCLRRLVMGLVALAVSVACGGAMPEPESPSSRTIREYEVDHWVIRNPERGWVQAVELTDEGDIAFVEGLGVSLAHARVRLDAFRDRPISEAHLSELEDGLAAIREAGLKVVLRFQYNIGSGKDPPLPRVLEHIGQLTPLIRENSDVIAVIQAGFIGAWGEWHTSISGLTRRENRERLLRDLLAAVPDDRAVQVRSPVFKQSFVDGPVTAETSHSGTSAARIGHHNDCVFADTTDGGTFPSPAAREYLETDSAYVPVGGESCAPSPPRSSCKNAIIELRRYHYSYLNRVYHPKVIAEWKRQGCFKVIERDLGYRLVLRRASWPRLARPGNAIRVNVRIENLGFAAPYNPRPMFLVIGRGADRYIAELPDVDVRRWRRGEPHDLSVDVALPDDIAEGSHPLQLWLPDPAPRLRSRPEYAIRMSNEGIWLEDAGTNLLGRIEVVR